MTTIGLLAVETFSTQKIRSAAFLLVLCVPIILALVGNRDPWLDEAMLSVNFVEMNLKHIADPMPFYDQAAPIAHIFLAKIALLFSGTDDRLGALFAWRALSAAIALAGFAFLIRLARDESSTAGALTVAALLFTSPYIIRYATEVKPYIFDFTATAILVYTAAGIARSGQTRDFVKFLVASFAACLLSFVAVVPILACLSAAALVRVIDEVRAQQRPERGPPLEASMITNDLWRFIAFGGAAVLIAVAFYVLFSRSMTELNVKSYPENFSVPFIALGKNLSENVSILWRLPKILVEFLSTSATFSRVPDGVESHLTYLARYLLAWLLLGLIVIALGFCASRSLYVAMSFATAVTLIVALNALRVLPLVQARFLLFVAPLLFLSIGLGGVEAYRRITSHVPLKVRTVVQIVGTVLLAVIYGAGLNLATTDLAVRDDRSVLAEIRSGAPMAPVWAYFGRQPVMRFLAPKEFREVGLFDPTSGSGPGGWFMRGGEVSQISAPSTQSPGYLTPNPGYLSKVEEQLRGHSKVWLYLEAERISPHEPYLAAAERAVGHCDLVKSAVNDRLYFCSAGATK